MELTSQHLIAYLDHQIWCGMADRAPEYIVLRNIMEGAPQDLVMLTPYSMIHIQELAEVGKQSGLSRTERIEKAMPKLEFIREMSRSILIAANDDYSQFSLRRRDPVEAFETLTEVELEAVATHNFTDYIPKALVQEIQARFGVGAKNLNNLSESEAIEKINSGMEQFSKKCQSDREFYRAYVDSTKQQMEELVRKGHSQALSVIEEARQISLKDLQKGRLSEAEVQSIQGAISALELRKRQLEESLLSQIQEVIDSCEKSYSIPHPQYSFDLLLDQVSQSEHGIRLPRSLNQTNLLNFFGYKSRLGNRRSDFYDALHGQYAKVCHFFVTEDARLQEKLGVLNSQISGSDCLLLNLESFERAVKYVVSNHGPK